MFSGSIRNFGSYLKKTPALTTALYYYDFKHHGKEWCWSPWAAPAMQSWEPAVPRAAVAHGDGGRWWRAARQHCCPACGDHTGTAQPPRPAAGWEEAKTDKGSGTEVLFPFFSSSARTCMSRAGVRSQPWCLCPLPRGADPARSTQRNRPECLCSGARWAVQGQRERKLLEVNESISIDFKDFGSESLTSTVERYSARANCYFLGLHFPAAHLLCRSQSIPSKTAKLTADDLPKSCSVPHCFSFQVTKSKNPPNPPALQTRTLLSL